ncbi:MAG: nucleotide exchange factor GrpE [Candidatus Eremiobacteraeota bacterium]|nr:nucleotide exchange factor GrpE [Candidatus Eremiobacteraeota bacterium]MBV9737022.1 nucleotide exchange factor GrpE [Candidatus Eremiobacteraeota bacterium]
MMQEDQTQSTPTEDEVSQAAAANGEVAANTDLKAQLEAANAKADENYNQLLLAMADFENYRKRVERHRAESGLAARRALLRQLLPVIDNLERALAFEDASEGLRGGVQQTLKGFESVLAAEGVSAIPDLTGEPFDPKVADAIETRAADSVPDDTVIEQTQKGYMLGDQVLRPAKVIVAKDNRADNLSD